MTRRSLSAPSLAALTCALAPGMALAQAFDLGEIVVSANLEDVAADRSGATVVVVDGADLQQSGEVRLVDTLNRLPGVSVRPSGPLGAQSGFAIRGASQNYVPVLIDGIEVTDPSGPQVAFNFGGLTTAGISRIEILKGSQSALYGSEAVGGVINITTRRATEDGVQQFLDLEAGRFDTRRLSYGLAARGDGREAAVTVTHARSDGFSAADENDGNTEDDGFRANRLSFSGSATLDNGVRLGASGFFEDTFAEFDESFPAIADGTPDETNDRRSWGLRGFAEFTTGAVDHTIEATVFDITRLSRSDGFESRFTGRREKLGYQGATDLGPARLVFGADTTNEESTDNFGFAGDNRVNGAFVEASVAPTDNLDITASYRLDDHSRFGNFDTGRLAAAWRIDGGVILRASAGRGFRAPSNFELFSDFGNPALQPERSNTLDIGVEKRFAGGASVRATAFYLEVDDLIDFDFADNACGSGGGCYAQVPGTSRRSGLELEGHMPLSDRLRLSGAYTYTDSSTNASSAWSEIARHDLVATLGVDLTERLSADVSAQHVANRGPGLSDYTLVHTTFTYALPQGSEAYLRVENLGDEQYQLVDGFGTSDRAVHVGLRTRF